MIDAPFSIDVGATKPLGLRLTGISRSPVTNAERSESWTIEIRPERLRVLDWAAPTIRKEDLIIEAVLVDRLRDTMNIGALRGSLGRGVMSWDGEIRPAAACIPDPVDCDPALEVLGQITIDLIRRELSLAGADGRVTSPLCDSPRRSISRNPRGFQWTPHSSSALSTSYARFLGHLIGALDARATTFEKLSKKRLEEAIIHDVRLSAALDPRVLGAKLYRPGAAFDRMMEIGTSYIAAGLLIPDRGWAASAWIKGPSWDLFAKHVPQDAIAIGRCSVNFIRQNYDEENPSEDRNLSNLITLLRGGAGRSLGT